MKSAADRIAHYINRMTSSQLDPVLAAVHTTQKANFAAYAIDWVAKSQAVHNYLDNQGTNPLEYFMFDAFAGEIYHIEQHFQGAAAVAGATDIVNKYTPQCGAPKLKAICLLFNIIVP
jgi:hypothetical protein